MIATILWKVLFRNSISSAITGAVMLLGALFVWHLADKGSAVRQAVSRFVAAAELSAAQAEAEELRNIISATRDANRLLQQGIEHAEANAAAWAMEIEAYENQNPIYPEGLVDADLHQRLRGN